MWLVKEIEYEHVGAKVYRQYRDKLVMHTGKLYKKEENREIQGERQKFFVYFLWKESK